MDRPRLISSLIFHTFIAKLPDPTRSKNLAVKKKLLAALIKKRERIDGMYRTLLNYPALAPCVGDLGTFLRFKSKLARRRTRSRHSLGRPATKCRL